MSVAKQTKKEKDRKTPIQKIKYRKPIVNQVIFMYWAAFSLEFWSEFTSCVYFGKRSGSRNQSRQVAQPLWVMFKDKWSVPEQICILWDHSGDVIFLRRAQEWKQRTACKRALGWFKSQHFRTRINDQRVLNRWCRRVVTDLRHESSSLFSRSLARLHSYSSPAIYSFCSWPDRYLQLASSLLVVS